MLDNILAAADIEATEIAGDACIEDYPDVSMISDYAMRYQHGHHHSGPVRHHHP